MPFHSPLFSIIVPTRNRAHLLGNALRSALAQTFDNYEIVISANDCRDNTRKVVEDMRSDRIRYFETDRMLTMPENWEYAWSKAEGDYVICLPDDDAVVPGALRFLADYALKDDPPVVSWEDAVYYYPDWHDEKARNVLLLFFHGDTLIEDIPAQYFRDLCSRFEFAWSAPLPKLLNCAAKRAYFEDWRQKLGKLFFPVAPDYSFAWLSSHICSKIRVIHRPLSIRGISDYSIGSNPHLGDATKEFYKEFGDFDLVGDSLLKLPLQYNQLGMTFLRINTALQRQGLSGDPIDWDCLMVASARELKSVEGKLPDWSSSVEILKATAHALSEATSKKVSSIMEVPAASTDTETLDELRLRTRKMAMAQVQNSIDASKKDLCTRCELALEDGVLADRNWQYIYLFGEQLGAHNTYDMSLLADKYYSLLINCRAWKLARAASKSQPRLRQRFRKMMRYFTELMRAN